MAIKDEKARENMTELRRSFYRQPDGLKEYLAQVQRYHQQEKQKLLDKLDKVLQEIG